MKEIGSEIGNSSDTENHSEFGRPEVYSLVDEAAWQDQEFKRIMQTSWPVDFPELQVEFPISATDESMAVIVELPETVACRTLDDYERQENIAWQRYEALVAHFWSNYVRISESAWERCCAIEQKAWQIYEEAAGPARLQFEEDSRPARARRDKAATLAFKIEYTDATKLIRQWRIETTQAACEEYEQLVKNARSEYAQVEGLAGLAYKQIVKSLRTSLEQSSDSPEDALKKAA